MGICSSNRSPAVQSATWPFRRKAIGWHRPSVRAVDLRGSPATRPADRLILLPLYRLKLQRCALTAEEFDEHLRRWSASRGQSLEDIDPDALGRPSDGAIVERLARAVGPWRVDPSTAGLQDMHDAADHPAIINPRLAACVVGRCGAIFANCASVSQKWSRIIGVPFQKAVNYNAWFMPSVLWVPDRSPRHSDYDFLAASG